MSALCWEMMRQSSLQTFSSGCSEEMESETQLLGSCAYMITARERPHQITQASVILMTYNTWRCFFSSSEALTKDYESFLFHRGAVGWVLVLSVWAHIYLFVVLVVSLNKLHWWGPLQQCLPYHSCTVAPLTLIWCNVLQDDPPLPWAIPTGTHLH